MYLFLYTVGCFVVPWLEIPSPATTVVTVALPYLDPTMANKTSGSWRTLPGVPFSVHCRFLCSITWHPFTCYYRSNVALPYLALQYTTGPLDLKELNKVYLFSVHSRFLLFHDLNPFTCYYCCNVALSYLDSAIANSTSGSSSSSPTLRCWLPTRPAWCSRLDTSMAAITARSSFSPGPGAYDKHHNESFHVRHGTGCFQRQAWQANPGRLPVTRQTCDIW